MRILSNVTIAFAFAQCKWVLCPLQACYIRFTIYNRLRQTRPEIYSQGIKNHDVYDAEGDVYGTWDGCKEALPSRTMPPVGNLTRDYALISRCFQRLHLFGSIAELLFFPRVTGRIRMIWLQIAFLLLLVRRRSWRCKELRWYRRI